MMQAMGSFILRRVVSGLLVMFVALWRAFLLSEIALALLDPRMRTD